jgi:hypothetical protein
LGLGDGPEKAAFMATEERGQDPLKSVRIHILGHHGILEKAPTQPTGGVGIVRSGGIGPRKFRRTGRKLRDPTSTRQSPRRSHYRPQSGPHFRQGAPGKAPTFQRREPCCAASPRRVSRARRIARGRGRRAPRGQDGRHCRTPGRHPTGSTQSGPLLADHTKCGLSISRVEVGR